MNHTIVVHFLHMNGWSKLQDYSLDPSISPAMTYKIGKNTVWSSDSAGVCGLFLLEERELIFRYKTDERFFGWYLGDWDYRVYATDPAGARGGAACASDSDTGTMVIYSGGDNSLTFSEVPDKVKYTFIVYRKQQVKTYETAKKMRNGCLVFHPRDKNQLLYFNDGAGVAFKFSLETGVHTDLPNFEGTYRGMTCVSHYASNYDVSFCKVQL